MSTVTWPVTWTPVEAAEAERVERESLRRQVELLYRVRDEMADAPVDWWDAWMAALVPLTEKVLKRLCELEGGDPIALQIRGEPWS